MKVINSQVTDDEMRVSMQYAKAVEQATVDVCKHEKVPINAGITALCLTLNKLAKKHGVKTETLVEVLRELAADESKAIKA